MDDRFTLGLIVDGHHLHDDVVRLVFAIAGDRVALVSDATAAAGTAGTPIELGGVPVQRLDDGSVRRADGTLGGSAISLDEAVRRCMAMGLPPDLVLTAAATVPAAGLGLADVGVISPGSRADLVKWDDTWHVGQVIVGGRALRP